MKRSTLYNRKTRRRMSGKNVVSSSTKTETKIATESDGTVVKTITTTTTEKYGDGSSGTKTKVETVREAPAAGANTGGCSANGIKTEDCKAPRAELTTDDQFIQECLQAHNEYRAKHGAPPVTLNKEMCKISQARANHNAAIEKMEHGDSGYGENIYWSSQAVSGRKAVEAWYSEIKDYNFNKLEGQKGTGHFTQLVWKGTKEVGIAKAVSKKGYTYVVANYNPPGNFVGKYPDNISKPK